MAKQKVLYVCHNHPTLMPGGAEAYALELSEAMRRTSTEFEPIFLARIGPDMTAGGSPHPGTPFSVVDGESNQYFFYSETSEFDPFYMTLRNKDVYTLHFNEFLLAHQPSIVHFQHTHYLGFDLIRQTRNTLPDAPILYTLHEFHAICHRHGQMVRTHHKNQELCHESSPRRCHECFPEISPQAFFMRQSFIRSHLSLVDLFLAPSHFLLERYVDWGIPREKIVYEEYGRRVVKRGVDAEDERPRNRTSFLGQLGRRALNRSASSEDERPRNRIGFFGQFSFFKGINDVLLEGMKIVGEDECDVHLWLYGANLERQPEEFRNKFESLLEETEQNVTLVGSYHYEDLPSLMANVDWIVVPSIWWENSPLVIQEAFLHGRPVICSDIGGMAEKVADGVNGLHFRAGDPRSLAQTIRRAVSTPGLWERLRSGIPEVYKIEDSVARLTETYKTLLGSRA